MMLSRNLLGGARKAPMFLRPIPARRIIPMAASQANAVMKSTLSMEQGGDSHLPKQYNKAIRSVSTPLFTKNQPSTGADQSTMADTASAGPLNPLPDFNNAQATFESKTTTELIRAVTCLRLCRFPFIVKNAEDLLYWSRKLLGSTITDAFVRETFFKHFCGGQDVERIKPVVKHLDQQGVGSILYFAAESDVKPSATKGHPSPSAGETKKDYSDARDAELEANADKHVEIYLKSIQDVSTLGTKEGYAAIKITALGNPKLLVRISQALVESKKLFQIFDLNRDGYIGREEFEQCYRHFFIDAEVRMEGLFKLLDPDNDDKIDYTTWCMMLNPRDMPDITASCTEIGPLALATPTEKELELMDKLYERVHRLAREASSVGTRLLIDAEQVRYQPAIDNLVLELQQTYNSTTVSDRPIIYNTYQCYLKDSRQRLTSDVERSERLNYHLGAKLVRGAYMESERELALKLGLESPVHDTIEDTHKNYNDAVDFLLQHSVQSDKKIEIMCATHNKESVKKALEAMNRYGINGANESSTLRFGQLLSMADNLSFQLGRHGYKAYKYMPYGEIQQVIAFLLRRANENSAIVGGTSADLGMVERELRRRIKAVLHLT